MKKTPNSLVTVKSGRRLKGVTDWKKLDKLSDKEVRRAADEDPDARPLTRHQASRLRRVSRVKALRERVGPTQEQFARAFHLPLTTLRDWEQRRSAPDAPARALLLAIERDPKRMLALLAQEDA